jgi:cytochrome c oxidase subunit 2
VILTVAVALGLVGSACGSDGPPLSGAGERGKEVAAAKGCQSCHGNRGQGGVGPTWQGLAGAERELQDGTTVVADDGYLRQSILEPDATKVAGYTVSMPSTDLDPSEIDALIAYINDLKDVQ